MQLGGSRGETLVKQQQHVVRPSLFPSTTAPCYPYLLYIHIHPQGKAEKVPILIAAVLMLSLYA